MRFVDLTGKKFGLLTVTKELGNNRIECRCDCGTIKEYDKYKVKTGKTKSCGCNRYNFVNDTQFKRTNRVGQTFNNLTIIKELGHDRVVCRCNLCGNEKELCKSKIVSGITKHCGCSRIKSNFIDLTGKVFGDITVIKQVQTNPVKWLCKCKCGNTTIVPTTRLTKHETTCCPKCVCKRKMVKVYGGFKKFSFSGTNVRVIKGTKPFKTNTSGVRGVSFRKKQNSWQARLCLRGEVIYLGSFGSLKEAEMARKQAERKYYKPILDKWNNSHEEKMEMEERK